MTRRDGGREYVRAHRLAYALHYGQDPAGMVVCHRCDNPSCVNPEHLFLGTQQDNIDDKMRKGRARLGEDHPNALLSAEDVRQIRCLLGLGIRHWWVASSFGVSRSTVTHIKNKRNWKNG